MAHEQSETVQLPGGRWVNVYGQRTPQAGQRIPDMPSFRDVEAAVQAARARSSESRGSPDDLDTMRMVYELMSNQEAAAQRGAGPSYRREYRLPGIMNREDWEPSLDWQDRYSTEPYPRTRPIKDINAAPPAFTPSTTPTKDVPGGWVRGALPDTQFLADLVKNLPHAGLGVVAQLLGTPMDIAKLALGIRPPSEDTRGKGEGTTVPLTTEWFLKNWGEEHPSARIASMVPVTGPSGTAKELPVMLSILAGAGAKGFNPDRLKEAQAMLDIGKSPQEIWKTLGISRGIEGGARHEIPAQTSEFSREVIQELLSKRGWGGGVSELVDEPELFRAYPKLASTPVAIRAGESLGGRINPQTRIISLVHEPLATAFDRSGAARELRSALEHEMQHWVQMEEGLPGGIGLSRAMREADPIVGDVIRNLISNLGFRASGPNLGAVSRYLRQAGEVEARNVQSRLRDPNLRRFDPSFTEDLPRNIQFIEPTQGMEGISELVNLLRR